MHEKKKNISILWRISSNDSNIGNKPEKQIIKTSLEIRWKTEHHVQKAHPLKSKLSVPPQHAGGTCADSCNGNKKKKFKTTQKYIKNLGINNGQKIWINPENRTGCHMILFYLSGSGAFLSGYCLFLQPFQNTSILFWTWGTQNYFLFAFPLRDVLVSKVNLWWKPRKKEGGVTL